ncbi:MAG: DNA/RNA non-specific endonuclease [Cyclobacteriaceae bacterium]
MATIILFIFTPLIKIRKRMNTRTFISSAVFVLTTCSSTQSVNTTNSIAPVYALEIPQLKADDVLIEHTGFALVYDEAHEQAKWVAYELTLEETLAGAERSNKFIPDPKISTGTATDRDYKGSGYDRGHLAPAADMSWSDQAMKESFYFSNISPQVPSFNRGIWKQLEMQVRKWARLDSAVHVVTGPILTEGLPAIGLNNVTVPAYFYKALLVYRNYQQKAIAFIIPNEKSALPIGRFAVTVDSLEQLTGLNFFPALPADIENKLESSVCLTCWNLEKHR